MRNNVKGQTVLITGATSGIGRAAALAFGAMGANLVLIARREILLDELLQQLVQQNNNIAVFTYGVDVSNYNQVTKFISKIPHELSQIDILINNAGLAAGLDGVAHASIKDWETMIDTNLKGLLYITKEVLPIMIGKNKGQIINIGSIAGIESYSKGSVYCATKAAVHSFTKSLRLECISHNIKVSEILPGAAKTEFSEVRFRGDKELAESVYDGIKPLSAEDIADMIIYLSNLPEHVNLAEVLILPTVQGSATSIFRK